MTKLERQIRDAVKSGRWSVSSHADDRCAERGVEVWQIVSDFDHGTTLSIDLKAKPNPKLLREQSLASGENIVVIWSLQKNLRVARLVTVYFEDS